MGNPNLQPIPATLDQLVENLRGIPRGVDSPAWKLLLEFYHIHLQSMYPGYVQRRVRPGRATKVSRQKRLTADLELLLGILDLMRQQKSPKEGLEKKVVDGYFSFGELASASLADKERQKAENERQKKRIQAAARALLAGESD